jgi:large subunit ribosomal protein L16
LRKKGKVHTRCVLNIPRTKKSTGVRMGKGKGDLDYFIGFVSKNDCFMEIKGVSKLFCIKLHEKLSGKLPFKVRVMGRDGKFYY